ncbi:plant UBX domain-containing protein 11 [Canna indica]|uniref:Plant UBX domain-containing protein 11 n=1 Tax=Canna indica TaxID=4628 RepID=A0AAQ3KSJ8_9LILI|nr:plant UBX domain-containing protein 11 [Canna indica]
MERSTYSFTYKGSISDAINESRNQKKLFMVYISGEDENSIKMDQLTWLDKKVAESISKYCIFLHLTEGSVDASQFSAIYPQTSIPNISTIGLNGILLWHYEGYITAENLIENVDKAWAALRMQEAALTFFTAALASKEPGSLIPTPNTVPPEQVISPETNVPSTSAGKPTEESEIGPLSDSQQLEESHSVPNSQEDNLLAEETCSIADSPNDVKSRSIDDSSSKDYTSEDTHSVLNNVDSSTTILGVNSNVPVENSTLDKNQAATSSKLEGVRTTLSPVPSQLTAEVEKDMSQVEMVDGLSNISNVVKSNDIHLNIRMPNGTGLQTKLTLADTLRSIKIFVDENLDTVVGSYDLAVPYPRKLFGDEDMNRTLSELGFASRQALIVVPHHHVNCPPRVQSSSNDSQNSVSGTVSSENTGGYFDYVKRMLSYVNPLSYLGGNTNSSNSGTTTNTGLWEYGPNPALQSHSSGSGPSQHLSSQSDQNAASPNSDNSMRPRPSRQFGSNIHTLRHDDDPSGDKNIFWNGNSTQFGGDNK